MDAPNQSLQRTGSKRRLLPAAEFVRAKEEPTMNASTQDIRQPVTDSSDQALLYSLWSVQDTLLQAYRTMFITVQSLLIAVAASIAGFNSRLAWSLVLVGFALLFVWSLVTRARGRDVQFAQAVIRWAESGRRIEKPFTTFKDYQSKFRIERKYTVVFADGSTEPFLPEAVWPPRSTDGHYIWNWGARLQLEIVLPSAYFLSWALLAFYIAVQP